MGMRRNLLKIMLAGPVAATAGLWASAAWSANWFEMNFWLSGPRYDSNVPLCQEHGPLNKIIAQWGTKEYRFWNSNLELVGFENIHELAWEPWQTGTIPRRYCAASALVSDGKRHQIYYSIIEDGGMLGVTYGVEFCVDGFDRNWADKPRCQMARP
jgi:hypothetical protein